MAVVCLWVVCVIKTSDSRHENLNLRTLLSFSGGLFNLFDKLNQTVVDPSLSVKSIEECKIDFCYTRITQVGYR